MSFFTNPFSTAEERAAARAAAPVEDPKKKKPRIVAAPSIPEPGGMLGNAIGAIKKRKAMLDGI